MWLVKFRRLTMKTVQFFQQSICFALLGKQNQFGKLAKIKISD